MSTYLQTVNNLRELKSISEKQSEDLNSVYYNANDSEKELLDEKSIKYIESKYVINQADLELGKNVKTIKWIGIINLIVLTLCGLVVVADILG